MKTINIASVERAVTLFYSKTEITTADIKELFNVGNTVANRLKKEAREVMKTEGAECWNANTIDTRCAFRAWHLDIVRLEQMLKKQRSLNLQEVYKG